MNLLPAKKRKVLVIGHKNPDTDSICSAIAYAHLKNTLYDGGYKPARAGELNQETKYVLERFSMETPKLYEDVSAQVEDIDIRSVKGAPADVTIHSALVRMRDEQVSTLPVVSDDGRLLGLVTTNHLAVSSMDATSETLANASTPLANLLHTLNGTLVTGSLEGVTVTGKIVLGSGSPELIETQISPGDVVICGNRFDAQITAIEMNAACMVLCSETPPAKTIVRLAEEHNMVIIQTPLDTFTVACTINQSAPIAWFMYRNLVTLHLDDPVETAKEIMGQVRYVYFPVLDSEGIYRGVISRRNFLNLRRRQLILVDHNERTQCVEGHEEAEILEIIDHHRINSIETTGPVFFRNQPVGCTATIIRQLYQENGVEIPPDIAGILCSAILSDTLMFRSPTCTPLDEAIARELAGLAGVDVEELAGAMFEAGENVEGKTAESLFYQDFKRFTNETVSFAVGQGSYVSPTNRQKAEGILRSYMDEALQRERVDMIFYLLTDIKAQQSKVLWAGEDADKYLRRAFDCQEAEGGYILPGVISRKKQFIPPLLAAMQTQEGARFGG